MPWIPNRRLIHSAAGSPSDVQSQKLVLPRNTLSISGIREILGPQLRFPVIRCPVFVRIV
jgi:hypothetical protein